MLFSSYTFLFQFLPATVLAFAAARRHSPRAGIMVLAGASLFFYGAWRPIYLLLLVVSIAVNFGLGLRMDDPLRRRAIGAFGVALNLAVLGLIALVPFPTEVYGNYPNERPAIIVYCVAISAPSIASAVLFRYAAQDNRLIDPSTPREWVIHSQLRSLSIPAVFLTSIPVSFIAVGLGQLWWLWMIPLRVYFTRRYGKITDVWDG